MNAKDVMLARALGSGDGSGYVLPVASPTRLGGVKPEAKTDAMAQPVGVDAVGKLWTELGGGGPTATPELLFYGTAENVTSFDQEFNTKGHKNFCIVVGGTKGDSNININTGRFRVRSVEYEIFYYTLWLEATNETYPNGSTTEYLLGLDTDKITTAYQRSATMLNGTFDAFQGSSQMHRSPSVAILNGYASSKSDGIELAFSSAVASVSVWVYGF